MKTLAVLGFYLAICQAFRWDDLTAQWETYKEKHQKIYDIEEDYRRLRIFFNNLKKIAEHNFKYQMGEVSYKIGLNQFTDMHEVEYRLLMRCSIEDSPKGWPKYVDDGLKAPNDVDWNKRGIVTDVKNQKHCGSCWAFSTTGSLEAQYALKTKQLVSLSEQNLVDCTTKCHGCNGGIMSEAFKYIHDNGGINSEEMYPYEGKDGKCRFDKTNIAATVKGFVMLPSGDETSLMNAVGKVGPVSVAIDASQYSFQLYARGIYDDPNCIGQMNHAVLVVGYGTENGKDYWLVKNSWGTRWGEKGYIKMSRNQSNQCNIATYGIYPVI